MRRYLTKYSESIGCRNWKGGGYLMSEDRVQQDGRSLASGLLLENMRNTISLASCNINTVLAETRSSAFLRYDHRVGAVIVGALV